MLAGLDWLISDSSLDLEGRAATAGPDGRRPEMPGDDRPVPDTTPEARGLARGKSRNEVENLSVPPRRSGSATIQNRSGRNSA